MACLTGGTLGCLLSLQVFHFTLQLHHALIQGTHLLLNQLHLGLLLRSLHPSGYSSHNAARKQTVPECAQDCSHEAVSDLLSSVAGSKGDYTKMHGASLAKKSVNECTYQQL